MTSAPQTVSFTIRRPTPPSRTESSGGDSDNLAFKPSALPCHLVAADDSKSSSPLARSAASSPDRTPITTYYDHDPDSSDAEDERTQDELLTSFDQIAVQRSSKKRKSDDRPLVIPVLKNKDWREVARKRRSAARFVPASAHAQTGRDGSAGGLGTNDSINTGPVLAGLQVKKETALKIEVKEEVVEETHEVKMEVEETEDERALRAVLASAEGTETEMSTVRIIPTPISESDALRQDVAELPDVATLEDYQRIPVSQFGAAMLRGMGWKEGSAASRNGKGLAKPYLPQARPALLGIGAKERELLDDGSGKKRNTRPERRYVPVVRKERDDVAERPRSPSCSGNTSRRSSRSPNRRKDRRDKGYDESSDRDGERYRSKGRDRDIERVRDSDRRQNGTDRRRDRSGGSGRRD